jgi:hypothetical protein
MTKIFLVDLVSFVHLVYPVNEIDEIDEIDQIDEIDETDQIFARGQPCSSRNSGSFQREWSLNKRRICAIVNKTS